MKESNPSRATPACDRGGRFHPGGKRLEPVSTARRSPASRKEGKKAYCRAGDPALPVVDEVYHKCRWARVAAGVRVVGISHKAHRSSGFPPSTPNSCAF